MDLKIFLGLFARGFEHGLGWFLPDALADATPTSMPCSG